MTTTEILASLRSTDPEVLEMLFQQADAIRSRHVGAEVHLRGLIEISNHCVRQCAYCGINRTRKTVPRYRMGLAAILEAARLGRELGYGTVVLQSGEDYGLNTAFLCDVIRGIKDETGLAVTLSLGERPWADLEAFRAAGADRYLLRFETSDPELYARIHPSLDTRPSNRFADLRVLRELGYEVGSGVMVGIPGQTWETLARDLDSFRELDLDMVGIGPYIPHPNTPLGRGKLPAAAPEDQVPRDLETTFKALALTRILCPEANLPTTTAVTTLDSGSGRRHGLERGANVIMPNLTPLQYRALYEIYPAKAGILERPRESDRLVKELLRTLGRPVGTGPGGRRRTPEDDDSSRAA